MDNVFQVYNKNVGVKKAKTDKMAKETDQIKISDKAIEFQFALQKVKNVEEMRMGKVEEVKSQIKAGTYEINENKIAEKILQDISFDKKI